MSGDDEAVRNGDDDGDSGADLELFRQLVAMPPKKCRRAACSSMSLCGVATSNCPNKTRKQSSGSRHRRNGVSATSHRTERIINVPMEVLLSAMLVRRTERSDGSTRQLEHRSVSERLAGRSLRQSGSGSMTGRRSRHRRSAASAVSRRRIGQGVGTISCSDPDRSLLVLPCRCPPWRAKRRMLADVFHWR